MEAALEITGAPRGEPTTNRKVSDEQLMCRVQDDDPDAFAEIYDRHAVRALRVARSVCRDQGRAEDAVQEGFLSIWRSRSSYRSEKGSVQGWVMTAARNRALDSLRHDAAVKRPDLVELEERDRHRSPDLTPADALAAGSDRDAMLTALRQLPGAQAEVIALAFFGELSHSEIATQLGLPKGTVKGRMRLGLEKLRRQMDAPGRDVDVEQPGDPMR